jgi:nitrous oxidase accessory protein NosD
MNGKRVLKIASIKRFTGSAVTRPQRYAAGFVATLTILFAMGTTAAAAPCTVPSIPYPTIQSAVNDPTCNPINVLAGLYPEAAPGPLTINRPVTLVGAQSGVDARNPRGPESIINDIQGTSVSASNVVIDGFTVQNSTAPAFTGFGIWLNPGISGTKIINNIIQDNIVGIGLANAGAQALIRHNWIRNNIKPGGAQGSGIYTDEFSGGPTVRNVLVQENTFSGHAGFGAAINISNTAPAGGVFNLDVDTNLFTSNSRAFVLFNTHDSTIHDNDSSGASFVGSADVRIFDNNTNLSILRNDLMMGAGHAIRLSDLGILGPSSGVEIHFNNIEIFALTGLTVDPLPPGHVGTVDAECNWWNSSTGPFNIPNNLTGTGEEVVGDADFTPWLIARYPAPCIGGLPSTPGKVTGGGQIEDSDPLFSPFGDLLTLPSILVSTNANGAQANFGFVIDFRSGAPAPKGNLTYQDHGTGTRIKAKSYDSLVIGPGICGPNTHATFTGDAEVNGVMESLIVQVDDCGEPSSGPPPDTFSITTDSYSNSGPLIGGNIKIH